MTNQTWKIADDITREQLVGGFYRYHTPVGAVACVGETGNWRLKYDNGFTTSLRTLNDCDSVIRSWIDDLRGLGVLDVLAEEVMR